MCPYKRDIGIDPGPSVNWVTDEFNEQGDLRILVRGFNSASGHAHREDGPLGAG